MFQKNDLVSHLSIIKDPRVQGRTRHNLKDILAITICAVICGAESWNDIEDFGHTKQEWFKRFLELSEGIPSHDTFQRVFSIIDSDQLQESFVCWMRDVFKKKAKKKVIAIDGKTLRRSHDQKSGKKAIHMVQALATEEGLILAQQQTQEKSNEITAIPELLKMLELKGCIVTIDAMGTQKAIVEDIIEKKADYCLAVKENQQQLYKDIKLYLDEQTANNFEHTAYDYYETTEKGHGRKEIRKYWITETVQWLEQKDDWKGLKSIGVVESIRIINDQETIQRRYYISSLKSNVKEFGHAVRNHWKVENSCHWILDVCFREDDCRKRIRKSAQNFAVIRRMALNILRGDKKTKRGVKGKRLKAGWDSKYLEFLLKRF